MRTGAYNISKLQWAAIIVFGFIGLMGAVQFIDNVVILSNPAEMQKALAAHQTTHESELIRTSFIIPISLGLAFFGIFSTVGFWTEKWQVRFWPVVPGLLLIYSISAFFSTTMFPHMSARQVSLGIAYLVLSALSGWLGLTVTKH